MFFGPSCQGCTATDSSFGESRRVDEGKKERVESAGDGKEHVNDLSLHSVASEASVTVC